jgi:hypothetical protein
MKKPESPAAIPILLQTQELIPDLENVFENVFPSALRTTSGEWPARLFPVSASFLARQFHLWGALGIENDRAASIPLNNLHDVGRGNNEVTNPSHSWLEGLSAPFCDPEDARPRASRPRQVRYCPCCLLVSVAPPLLSRQLGNRWVSATIYVRSGIRFRHFQ